MTGLPSYDWTVDRFFDSAIMRHGSAPWMRDYDVVTEVSAVRPDGTGSYIEGRYRYRFTHRVEAATKTKVPPETWRVSWSDDFIDYAGWERAGKPGGFVWGVEWAEAYPGAETVVASQPAAAWSVALEKAMHAIRIETNVYVLDLICHDLQVTQLAVGDPDTGTVRPID